MRYGDAVKEFKSIAGDLWEKQVDYWTAELAWAGYVDGLCRNGYITERQYRTWNTPFRYGKRLSVKKHYSR